MVTRIHKTNSSDISKLGVNYGVGVLESLDVYISAETSKVPSMYFLMLHFAVHSRDTLVKCLECLISLLKIVFDLALH